MYIVFISFSNIFVDVECFYHNRLPNYLLLQWIMMKLKTCYVEGK